MSKHQDPQHTIRNIIQLISLLIMAGIAVKKLMEWMRQGEGTQHEQKWMDGVAKLVQQQVTAAKSASAKPKVLPAAVKKTVPKPKITKAAAGLNKRQEQIYNMIKQQGELNMQALTKKFASVSSRTLRRDMTQLENLGLVSQSGRTKNSVYRLSR